MFKISSATAIDAAAVTQLLTSAGIVVGANEAIQEDLALAFSYPNSSAYWLAVDPQAAHEQLPEHSVVGYCAVRALGPGQSRLISIDMLALAAHLPQASVVAVVSRLLEVAVSDMPALLYVPIQQYSAMASVLEAYGFHKADHEFSAGEANSAYVGLIR